MRRSSAGRLAAAEGGLKRLSVLDVALLATLVPLWIAAFSLHVRQVATGRLAWVGVFVTSPAPDEYPQVRGFWRGMAGERSGLAWAIG